MRLYQLVATGEDVLGSHAHRYSRIVYTKPPGDAETEDFISRVITPRDERDMGHLDHIDSIVMMTLELCDNRGER